MTQSKVTYSKPVFEQTFTIHSLQAQRVLDRVFRRTVSALYGIDVILHIIGDPEEIEEVEGVITALLSDCGSELDAEQARMQVLLDEHGIDTLPAYTDPRDFTARISSPQVGQFVTLIRRLDRLMISLDTLWLNAVLTNRQRADGNFAWQQRIIRLARRVIEIEVRARKSARVKGKEGEVEAVAPGEMVPEDLGNTAIAEKAEV
jgi:hypothetical protein